MDYPFGVIPWNSSAEYVNSPHFERDYLERLGEIIYGLNNTVRVDIKFISSEPGFIVQYINRVIMDNDIDKKYEISYYEIFYIGKDTGESFNVDSFLIAEDITIPIVNGSYRQVGISNFFPYEDLKGDVKFDKNGVMQFNSNLQDIFGKNVKFGELDSPAGGLPFSLTRPEMNNLLEYDIDLEREVTAKWKDNEEIKVNENLMYIRDGYDLSKFKLERFEIEKLSAPAIINLSSLLGSKSKTFKGAEDYLASRSSNFFGDKPQKKVKKRR